MTAKDALLGRARRQEVSTRQLVHSVTLMFNALEVARGLAAVASSAEQERGLQAGDHSRSPLIPDEALQLEVFHSAEKDSACAPTGSARGDSCRSRRLEHPE